MTAPIRYPRVDRVTERALYWRSSGFGKKRILAGLQHDFPGKDIAHLETCAALVHRLDPKVAGYRYECSNFTDDEWERFAAGETRDAIYIERLDRGGR